MTAGATIAPHRDVLGLTPQQWAFCEAYVANGGNGTQAAITAGYGVKSAHVRASKLLAMDKIQQALALIAVPAVAKAAAEVDKKAAENDAREEQLEARELAVAELETLEQLRERIRGSIVKALCGMAFTRMDDLARWTEEGVEFTPSEHLTPEALEAIAEIESQCSEGESQDGKTLFRNIRLKVKRHDRLGAIKELGRLLEIGPAKAGGPGGSQDRAQGPAVLIVVAGGPTGLERGAPIAVVPPGVTVTQITPGAAVRVGGSSRPPEAAATSASVPRGTLPHAAPPQSPGATPLRKWNPAPGRKPAGGLVHVQTPES